MHTTLEQTDTLYRDLIISPLKAAITGDIYQDQRPEGSAKEDVVINSIPVLGAEAIQRGISNVNIHIPALEVEVSGVKQKMPNHNRIKTLASIALTILKDVTKPDRNYWIELHGLIKDPVSEDYYYNFRIRFKFHNTNY